MLFRRHCLIVSSPDSISKGTLIPHLLHHCLHARESMIVWTITDFNELIGQPTVMPRKFTSDNDSGYEHSKKEARGHLQMLNMTIGCVLSKITSGTLPSGRHLCLIFSDCHYMTLKYDIATAYLKNNHVVDAIFYITSTHAKAVCNQFSLKAGLKTLTFTEKMFCIPQRWPFSPELHFLGPASIRASLGDIGKKIAAHSRLHSHISKIDRLLTVEILEEWMQCSDQRHIGHHALIYLPDEFEVQFMKNEIFASNLQKTCIIVSLHEYAENRPDIFTIVFMSTQDRILSKKLPVVSLIIDFGTESDIYQKVDKYGNTSVTECRCWSSHDLLEERRKMCEQVSKVSVFYMFNRRVLRFMQNMRTTEAEKLGKYGVARSLFKMSSSKEISVKHVLEVAQNRPLGIEKHILCDLIDVLRRGGILVPSSKRSDNQLFSWTKYGQVWKKLELPHHLCRTIYLSQCVRRKEVTIAVIFLCSILHELQNNDLELSGNLNHNEHHTKDECIFVLYETFLNFLTHSSQERIGRLQSFFTRCKDRCLQCMQSLAGVEFYTHEGEITFTALDMYDCEFLYSNGSKSRDHITQYRLSPNLRELLKVLLFCGYASEPSYWFVGTPSYPRRCTDDAYQAALQSQEFRTTNEEIVIVPYTSLVQQFSNIKKLNMSIAKALLQTPLFPSKVLGSLPEYRSAIIQYHKKTSTQMFPNSTLWETQNERAKASSNKIWLPDFAHSAERERDMHSEVTLKFTETYRPHSYELRSVLDNRVAYSKDQLTTGPDLGNLTERKNVLQIFGFAAKLTFCGRHYITLFQRIEFAQSSVALLLASWAGDIYVLHDKHCKIIKALCFSCRGGSYSFMLSSCLSEDQYEKILIMRKKFYNASTPPNYLKDVLEVCVRGTLIKRNEEVSFNQRSIAYSDASIWRWVIFERISCTGKVCIDLHKEFSEPLIFALYDNIILKRSREKFVDHFVSRLKNRLCLGSTPNINKETALHSFCCRLLRFIHESAICSRHACDLHLESLDGPIITEGQPFAVLIRGIPVTLRSLVIYALESTDYKTSATVFSQTNLSFDKVPESQRGFRIRCELDYINVLLIRSVLAQAFCSILPLEHAITLTDSKPRFNVLFHTPTCQNMDCGGCYSLDDVDHIIGDWVIQTPSELPSVISFF